MNERQTRRARVISILCLVTLIFFAFVVGLTSLTRHAVLGGERLSPQISGFIRLISEFPMLVRQAFIELHQASTLAPEPLLLQRASVEKDHWIRQFPYSADDGYILFSGVDKNEPSWSIKLIRISTGEVVFRWDPDWKSILKSTSEKPFTDIPTIERMRAVHPLLLEDGSIVFNTSVSLVKVSPCRSEPSWLLDVTFHHSLERSIDGNIWAAAVNDEDFSSNSWLNHNMRDDAIAKVSPEGDILDRRSITKILMANGLGAYVFGLAGKEFRIDPIHLNQISEADRDSQYWKKGDLLLSARHMSTVFLYRPSTNKIIWHSTGPWMYQHAAQFVDDQRIAVYDNNVFGGALEDNWFVNPTDTNRIFVFDFARNTYEQPFERLLSIHKPITPSQGRMRLLPDGGLFLEETDFG